MDSMNIDAMLCLNPFQLWEVSIASLIDYATLCLYGKENHLCECCLITH